MNYQTVRLETWSRAEHFKFYKNVSHPWFNICCHLDASKLYQYCDKRGKRFSHAYLYLTQTAINSNAPFRYRIVDDDVREYQNISLSVAVIGDDDMMRFCNLKYAIQFNEFTQHTSETEKRVKSQPFIASNFIGGNILQDVIHISVLPWVNFTSVTNPRNTDFVDSMPKVFLANAPSMEIG